MVVLFIHPSHHPSRKLFIPEEEDDGMGGRRRLMADNTAAAILIETARRRRRLRERRQEFICFVCVFCFFSSFFFSVGRELGWSKRWRRITSLSICPQSLACNVALNPELKFQYFLRSEFFSSCGWRFCDFFAEKGEK